jgi:hypothetical protein
MSTQETISIRGIGWLDGRAWGRVLSGEGGECPAPVDTLWRREDVFGGPVKNAGRFDGATRLTMLAVALAIGDGVRRGQARPGRTTGLLGASRDGSTATNLAYFRDYLDAGRTLARGNLFIYTLPTSPLAEVSIHFGFEGPMLYAGFGTRETAGLLALARTLLADGTPELLAVRLAGGTEAIAFWLAQDGGLTLTPELLGADRPAGEHPAVRALSPP